MFKQEFFIKYKFSFTLILSVASPVILLLVIFSNLYLNEWNINFYFSSDTLYLPSLYNDLFIDNGHIKDWRLNPAPNFFPDMFLHFTLMFLTKNFVVTSLLFSMVQYLLIGFLFHAILRIIFPQKEVNYTLFIFTFLSLYLLESLFFTKNFMYNFYVLINSYHTGAFLISLLGVLVSFKYLKSKKWIWLFLLFILGILAVVSDRLFIILFVIPFSLTALVLCKRIGIKTSLLLVFVNVLVAVLGLYVFNYIDRGIYNKVSHALEPAEMSVVFDQWKVFANQMLEYLKHFGFMMITICLFILSLFMMMIVFFKSLKNHSNTFISFYALFSLIFSACVILVPIVSGHYSGESCWRYSVFPFYLSVLNISIFLADKVQNNRTYISYFNVSTVLSVLFIVIGLIQFNREGLNQFLNYYPENARKIDAIAEKENLKFGVANYWESKKITMFSKKGVKIYPVFDNVAHYMHVANDRWFFDNIFNFVVLTNFSDTSLFRDNLSNIEFVSNKNDFVLIKTHPFTYKPGGSTVPVKNDIN